MQILKEKGGQICSLNSLGFSLCRVCLPTSWLIFCTLACPKELLLIAELSKPYLSDSRKVSY